MKGGKMKLHIVQAEFGDCLMVETSRSSSRKLVLIDGGPKGNYQDNLKPALMDVLGAKKSIDLLVLSHIDNDHVLGLLEYLADLKELRKARAKGIVKIKNLWHNSLLKIIQTPKNFQGNLGELAGLAILAPTETTNPDGSRGFKEGDQLEDLAHDVETPINREGGGSPITIEQYPKPVQLGKFEVWIVGPSTKSFSKLQKEWQAWFTRQAAAPGMVARGSEAMSDDSTTNLSSIMFLLKEKDRSILFTGDGLGDDILNGLEKIGYPRVDGRYHVNVLKLPHHGSIRNIDGSFFKNVIADLYVVSANGRNGNPEFQTLDWIASAAAEEKRQIRFIFTNKTDTTEQFEKKYPPGGEQLSIEYLPIGAHFFTVEI
jgi:beta-lactamase superfamily II metal-dependent hydrolase